MVVGEKMLDHLDPLATQGPEEAARIADSRNGMNALAAECIQRTGLTGAVHSARALRCHAHQQSGACIRVCGDAEGGVFGRSVENDQVDTQCPGRRLAQRACRQHPSVPKPPGAIEDDDLAVAGEPQMLQAIIGENDVDAVGDECLRGRYAITADHGRTPRPPPQE